MCTFIALTRITVLPTVTTSRNRYIFNEGDSVWLNFTVTGYPSPHMFTWHYNGFPLMNASHVRIHSGSLHFRRLSRQQEGEYMLTVHSIAGSATGAVYIDIYCMYYHSLSELFVFLCLLLLSHY